jgi:hypothetical protein
MLTNRWRCLNGQSLSIAELHVSAADQLPFVSNLIGIANMAAIDANMAIAGTTPVPSGAIR